MKVVLFCGGLGMRLREYSQSIPKPMVNVGNRPILWHVMKYYAHHGYKDFVLCLGWQSIVIKEFFLNYNECVSNDFVVRDGGRSIQLLNSDIEDWNITFVDTGVSSNIGQRLKAVEPHLEGETEFFANYTDGLTDFHLPNLVDLHRKEDAIASFISVRPTQSFHRVFFEGSGRVESIQPIVDSNVYMNGGYFMFNQSIFDYLRDGEELVDEPFQRLIDEGRLSTLKHNKFWCCLDTFKEKQNLDEMYLRGDTPWQLWKTPRNAAGSALDLGIAQDSQISLDPSLSSL